MQVVLHRKSKSPVLFCNMLGRRGGFARISERGGVGMGWGGVG